jgi:hypothetical protein
MGVFTSVPPEFYRCELYMSWIASLVLNDIAGMVRGRTADGADPQAVPASDAKWTIPEEMRT